jgi:hypothetical protein
MKDAQIVKAFAKVCRTNTIFERTYSRDTAKGKETWAEAAERVKNKVNGLKESQKLCPLSGEEE